MTNFEMITKDEVELANWLSDARIGCDMCPVETECSKDCGPIYDRCYRLILEWLERDEEAEERSTCQDSRQVGLEGLHPDDVKAVKEILERASKNAIDHPNHYQLMDGVEVIDIIDHILSRADLTPPQDFCLGNVIKYIMRADLKNGVEDYKKAAVYLNRLIDSMEKGK